MEDVSRVIGRTLIEWGKEFIVLDNFGFDDWSVIQSRIIREKRTRMLQAVIDMRDILSEGEYKREHEAVMDKVGRTTVVTGEEVNEMLAGQEGVILVMFVLIDRRYPGKYSKANIEKMFADGAITEADMVNLQDSLAICMGSDPAKNSIGQSTEAVKTSEVVSE